MSDRGQSGLDEIVDLLADEVAARIEERSAGQVARATRSQGEPAHAAAMEPERPAAGPSAKEAAQARKGPPSEAMTEMPVTEPSHASRLMWRLAIGLLVAVVLINIPFNRHGTRLATAMPDAASLVIRNGLVVKEADDEDIYIFQDGTFRWITSMDVFQHLGLTWKDVHVVESGFLDRFEVGAPLYAVLKCTESPHVYQLEDGRKRWIVDIATFEAQGHKWEDVQFVSCSYLRQLPDGETIPPGHGPPPQP